MQPLGKQPSYRPIQSSDESQEAGSVRAPASAVNAIMGRLGLAREREESQADEAALARDLSDPSWVVRVGAVQKLGKMGKQAPLGLLLAAMRDEQSSVRAAAARALGHNPRQAALSALVAALEDAEWLVRAEAALTLGKMRELAPLEPLFMAMRDKDAAVRAAAVRALGEIGTGSSLEPVNAALQDEDWSVREAATLALAWLEEKAVIPSLLNARLDSDPSVRAVAEAALQQVYPEIALSPPPPSDSFERWLERIDFPQEHFPASEKEVHDHAALTVHSHQKQRGKAKASTRCAKKSSGPAYLAWSLRWSRKIAHTAEGLLAVIIITCLIMAWMAIETQPSSTQGQAGNNNNSHTTAFTTYRQHDSGVEKLAWSPDGRTIASADIRGTVRIWLASTGYTLRELVQQGTVLALTWNSSDTLLVAYAKPDRSLQVWEFTIGLEQRLHLLFQQPNLLDDSSIAAWSSDKQTLAFETSDGFIHISNVVAGLDITTIQEKHTQYAQLVWSPDNTQLATISTTGLLEVWDAYTGQRIISLLSGQLATIATWISAGHYRSDLLFVNTKDAVMEWSYGRGGVKLDPLLTEQTYNFANTSGLIVSDLALSPDGNQFLLATSDGLVQARDLVSGNLIYLYSGHNAQVNDIEWSPDDQHIATASMDASVQIWQEP